MHTTIGHKVYFSILLMLLFSLSSQGQKKLSAADTLLNVRLKEVVVTAVQPDVPGTSSVIGRDAIRHIQATDLSGLTQLLPGVLTRNPNLNTPAVFTIRSATYDNVTNALGTAIVVDGLRMNNNGNMQQAGFGNRQSLYNSTALSGFDVRQLSPSSVESVEVIRGVPSARYGDVTSGVVLVNSRAGIQPLTVGLRFTATEKLVSVGQGIALGNRNSTFYWGADYAYSEQDSRLPERAFQRIAFQGAYAKDFAASSLRLHLRGYWGKDKGGRGANNMEGEFQKMLSHGFSFSANGRWTTKKPWLTELEYRIGGMYGHQQNQSSTYNSGTQQVTTYTREPGEQEGIFLPPNYFDALSVDGKPISADASLTAHLRHTIYNKAYHHLQLGVEAGTEGNRGKGIEFDPSLPPLSMLETRTRSYRSIPFIHRFAAFAEDRISFRIGRMRAELQAGLRITGQQTRALNYTPSFDPRINVRQVLIEEDDALFSRLSIHAGWGLMHKLPVLAYIYPDRSYTDKNSFTYNDTENNQRLAVMHTYVTDGTFNSQLQLPVNRKLELGVSLTLVGITADVVWFNEHLRNGFCTASQAEPFAFRRYDYLQGKGQRPTLTPDGVANNGQPVPYTTQNDYAIYLRPENGITQRKQGIEYTIDLGHWKALRTSMLVSGSWLEVRETNTALSAYHPAVTIGGKAYPYVGLYETAYGIANLHVWSQSSTRFQCITQLPCIGLVASLTLQAVWTDRERRGMESRYDNPVYTDDALRKKLNPVFYLDAEGQQHRFTPEMATDPRFADLVRDAGTTTAFETDSWGPYFLLNFRVTKEIGRHVSVAFCANNLTQSNPKRYTNSTRQYTILNPDLYYGAEVTIRF